MTYNDNRLTITYLFICSLYIYSVYQCWFCHVSQYDMQTICYHMLRKGVLYTFVRIFRLSVPFYRWARKTFAHSLMK